MARFGGREGLLRDLGILFRTKVRGQLEIHPELPHRRHRALIEVTARDGVIGVQVAPRQGARQVVALDHLLFAGQCGSVRAGMRQHVVQRRRQFAGRHVFGHLDVPALRPVEQRVNLDLLRFAFLLVAQQLRLEDGELRLRLEHVLLRRAPHRIAHLGDSQDVLQQFLVAAHEGDAGVGVVQFVVRLLDARRDVEAHREALLVLRGGFLRRDLAAQLALAGKG